MNTPPSNPHPYQITEEALEGFSPSMQAEESKSIGPQKLPISLFIKTVEQAPIAISITDKKGNILYINEAFSSVTGYQAAEILGENESILSDKSTPRQIYYDLWHTISRKKIWRGRLINRRKHGERYLAELTITPMINEDGAISHYIGMHRDITAEHAFEQQGINQKLLIESVINASPIAMVVLDSRRQIILDNEMYKMLISELSHHDPVLLFLEALQHELGDLWESPNLLPRNFSNHEIHIEGTGHRNSRWFSCSGNWFIEKATSADQFFSKQSTDYLLLSIHDITQQRRQQEQHQLQTLRDRLAEEEHLRSIRETLLGAMHQISQPMNQINAAIQLMNQRNDTQHQALKDLLTHIQSMGEQTIETLQRCVPKIPESTVLPVNLNLLLHEVLLLFSNKFLANGIVIDWLPSPVLPSILGSENKLRMLFKQLIDNSVNALKLSGNSERLITLCTTSEHNWILVRICDSGPGIPVHQRTKVFEPFFSTRSRDGLQVGMGLVMAKEIVSQHQGLIEIDPNYSNGCCIKLSFPICPKNIATVTDYE